MAAEAASNAAAASLSLLLASLLLLGTPNGTGDRIGSELAEVKAAGSDSVELVYCLEAPLRTSWYGALECAGLLLRALPPAAFLDSGLLGRCPNVRLPARERRSGDDGADR
eukprot:m.363169 g.363169  ORF g.363169 m.363169 type:complete len:111 (+) comp21586_c0_seq1:459-791(+)